MNRLEVSGALEDMLEDFQYLHKTVELVKDLIDQEDNKSELNEFEQGKLRDLIKTIHKKQGEIDDDIAVIQKTIGYKLA